MPQETDRLKLPLPLGNENVTRESINGIFEKIDAGVATQADLDTLREAVSKMDIPDASLTQKGKVQLSSKTDGTSETVAATEKAVRDARVAAINVATTDAIANAKSYIDTKTWQKHKLTADDGKSQLISGTDLNSLVANGQYNGNSLTNAPIPASVDEWWYIDVQCHSNGTGYVIQRASRLNGGTQTLYQRTRENNIWQPWSFDVFQSGVDAKKAVVDAINAKGGSASTSDLWATVASKINTITTKKPQVVKPTVSVTSAQSEFMGAGSRYYEVATFPAGTGFIESFNLTAAGSFPHQNNIFIGSGNSFSDTEIRIVLIDKNNTEWIVCSNSADYRTFPVDFLSIHIDSGMAFYRNQYANTPLVTMNMPWNFERAGAYRLSFRQLNKSTGWSHADLSFFNTSIYSF
ncbi:tail fiber protein [Paenibacillus illinoisensis]|uniref:pyocin knob domain-containing protein n=1 Tax=Paenibacillus illinoisensis TaxID=59845 RepID=UPI003D2C3BCC